MGIRSREQLLDDQALLLEAIRSPGEESVIPSVIRDGSAGAIGRVDSVVISDATYGPHLVVAVQTFAGAPPVATNDAIAFQRVYPTPNRVVGDYVVNEYVQMLAMRGALMAGKLG
jgi:hypothetical protein